MINQSKKQKETEQKQKIHRRVYTKIDPENYEFIPAKKQIDYYDNDYLVLLTADTVRETEFSDLTHALCDLTVARAQ